MVLTDVTSMHSLEAGGIRPQYDLVCFSHLNWNFVYQRPQHLLSRFAKQRRVFFFEEPTFIDGPARLDIHQSENKLFVVKPLLPTPLSLLTQSIDGLQMHSANEASQQRIDTLQRQLLNGLLTEYAIESYVLWYYTPMALSFSDHLKPLATVYDCMDELSAFKNAPSALREREKTLFERADIVFTGGQSLYEAKRGMHPRVYAFPSSVDAAHFRSARIPQQDPEDQVPIPHPRLGFYGVLDERLDLELLRAVADAQPTWHLVLIGPIAKINAAHLPHRENIHYLGPKPYSELPRYLSGWDVALLPFARNESTRFISPTKTPEYLAGGKPVVSTPIHDVVKPYGEQGLVHIAATPDEFIVGIRAALNEDIPARLQSVNALLARTGWDTTWSAMKNLIEEVVVNHQEDCVHEENIYV